MYKTLKSILKKSALLTILLIISCKSSNKKDSLLKQPNIIVILIDDAGYVDFGFMGSNDLETPNIDKLAKQGVVFTDAHVSATVCAPSRAGLITGKYQQRFGFEANNTGDEKTGDIGLSDDVVTMADVFKENGYKTIAIGKWHLGYHESDHPNNRGFDEFYGFETGSRSYFPIKNPSKKVMLQHNGKKVTFDGYMTDVLGDKSVKFIEENKDKPFFMYLAYNAVHTPMHAKEEHLEKYKNHPRQKLAAMTWSLDENIGKLQQKLKELNIEENTLIYFLSDNGGAANNTSSGGPLKGWKGNKFEGGHRVPFIVSWPSQIKGNQTFSGLSSSLDIFTTSLAAATIKKDKNLLLDGVDLLPYLKGKKQGNPHNKLFWRKLEEAGARVGDYKMIRLQNYGATLYNLKNDIGETVNLKTIDTLQYQLLQKELTNWESKIMPPLWAEERNWMDVTYHIHQRLMENKKVLYKSPSEMKNN
ncbi:sulfatase-like hydrolase/transferase [Wenyingzhuangia sp. 2_MG-2023]|uniref:sulfatase-like hydrolase/transferase n=1 Tax=Wenyingzhuangia sp. 2_MG-2023 TaxID=3062639 RepID=UPI0026E46CCB|nr:sulfatase-like hydrolase/transferase [Wenyingzhuangia sp. 2_MG-2023]MDO6736667.1 sulfatase-like hydrolase/transferase [Wenyingzhuangia sp. 2_MG-2023]